MSTCTLKLVKYWLSYEISVNSYNLLLLEVYFISSPNWPSVKMVAPSSKKYENEVNFIYFWVKKKFACVSKPSACVCQAFFWAKCYSACVYSKKSLKSDDLLNEKDNIFVTIYLKTRQVLALCYNSHDWVLLERLYL